MFVTTSGRPSVETVKRAKRYAAREQLPFIERNKRSIAYMHTYSERFLAFGNERDELYVLGEVEPFFFHPNMALIRYKRMKKGEQDVLLEACQLSKGQSVIDCTLGRGADSIMLSLAVGKKGRVISLEKQRDVHYITSTGLQQYEYPDKRFVRAMRRIETYRADALDYLRTLPDDAVDVVYCDPLFERVIEESATFAPLRLAGARDDLTEEWMEEARRVARQRVVVKAHYESPIFEQFQLTRDVRKSSKFHYGTTPSS